MKEGAIDHMRTLSLLVGCWMLVAACWGEGTPSNGPTPLADNVTIHIRGSVTDDSTVDIQVSGIGPEYSCVTAEPAARFQCSLKTTSDSSVTLIYNLGVTVPVKTPGTAPSGVQYKDFGLQGRVAVTYGEEIRIATINGRDFVLTVTKYAKGSK